VPRENRPCERGIRGQRVNWKRNWELEMHVDAWRHNDVGLATARVNCSVITLTVPTEDRDLNYRRERLTVKELQGCQTNRDATR
jgi:hypothetical protein